jgi:hypothetical protein
MQYEAVLVEVLLSSRRKSLTRIGMICSGIVLQGWRPIGLPEARCNPRRLAFAAITGRSRHTIELVVDVHCHVTACDKEKVKLTHGCRPAKEMSGTRTSGPPEVVVVDGSPWREAAAICQRARHEIQAPAADRRAARGRRALACRHLCQVLAAAPRGTPGQLLLRDDALARLQDAQPA